MLTTDEVANLPLAGEVDVLVLGGGPAGVSCAFAASRMGADVLIVEQFNCLGGIATAGGHGHICLYCAWHDASTRVVGGVIWELAQQCARAGYGQAIKGCTDFEVEGMKMTLEDMAEQAGTELLYYTQFADSVVEDGRLVEVVIQSKSGRQRIRARRFVDCTGDGDVAARAGCGFDYGDPDNGECQPMTLMFTIGGVDWSKVAEWRTSYGMTEVWEEAQAAGDMRPFQNHIMGFWHTPSRPDQVGINFTHINHVDARSAEDLTHATREGRKQAYESIEVFRKYVPGMENCYMISTPNTVGTRESRRIHGEYTLSRDDLVHQREHEDSIGYGSFFIDIHGTEGPGMDRKTWRPPTGFRYQMPFRITVPRDVDNLLVAGRCVSADHEALGSLRVMPQCGVLGQATGVASVMSIRNDCLPREVDVPALQDELRSQGCIIDENDIEAAQPDEVPYEG